MFASRIMQQFAFIPKNWIDARNNCAIEGGINECLWAPCRNCGRCVNLKVGYRFICFARYSRENCETDEALVYHCHADMHCKNNLFSYLINKEFYVV